MGKFVPVLINGLQVTLVVTCSRSNFAELVSQSLGMKLMKASEPTVLRLVDNSGLLGPGCRDAERDVGFSYAQLDRDPPKSYSSSSSSCVFPHIVHELNFLLLSTVFFPGTPRIAFRRSQVIEPRSHGDNHSDLGLIRDGLADVTTLFHSYSPRRVALSSSVFVGPIFFSPTFIFHRHSLFLNYFSIRPASFTSPRILATGVFSAAAVAWYGLAWWLVKGMGGSGSGLAAVGGLSVSLVSVIATSHLTLMFTATPTRQDIRGLHDLLTRLEKREIRLLCVSQLYLRQLTQPSPGIPSRITAGFQRSAFAAMQRMTFADFRAFSQRPCILGNDIDRIAQQLQSKEENFVMFSGSGLVFPLRSHLCHLVATPLEEFQKAYKGFYSRYRYYPCVLKRRETRSGG